MTRCADESCGIDARQMVTHKGKPINLCWQHYERFFAKQAARFVEALGLVDQPAKYAWCMARIADIGRPTLDAVVKRWESLRDDPDSSTPQRMMAKEAIGKLNHAPLREPGSD